jgi:TetR/AcrR family transcriptional regulator
MEKKVKRRSNQYHLPPGVARQSLLTSAIELLNERGMGKVSLNDVARAARLNPALVNYYFGTKENLFHAVVEQIVAEWRTEILAASPENASPEETLRCRARATMFFLRRFPALTGLIWDQMMKTETKEAGFFIENFMRVNLEEQRQILRRGVDEGAFRSVNPLFFFVFYIGVGDLFWMARSLSKRLSPREESEDALFERFVDHTVDMLINGIRDDSARQREAKGRAAARPAPRRRTGASLRSKPRPERK